MTKRKAITPVTGAGRRGKRQKPISNSQAFVWKPKEWKEKDRLNQDVTILVKISDPKRKVVEKVLLVDPGHTDHLPIEIQALEMLPDCNRIVESLHYARDNQNPQYGKLIYEHYPLGDVEQWREREFWAKNFKPVLESYTWRLFLQMAQALALLQNRIGPDRDTRKIPNHQHEGSRDLVAGRHYLATSTDPVQDPDEYETEVLATIGRDSDSSQIYPEPEDYYAARAPRIGTAINLSQDQQRRRGFGSVPHDGYE